ncbi:hypothetical protein E2C01_093994 [Portunus trituberculatus]|uniref:Uncharacterized protein n=1 Tax=Portunus trituberculatus TaxID=210409 RepID=A0A5B7JP96_PORTR|nr:hypothetical protein [Portunus trituberculatus]
MDSSNITSRLQCNTSPPSVIHLSLEGRKKVARYVKYS